MPFNRRQETRTPSPDNTALRTNKDITKPKTRFPMPFKRQETRTPSPDNTTLLAMFTEDLCLSLGSSTDTDEKKKKSKWSWTKRIEPEVETRESGNQSTTRADSRDETEAEPDWGKARRSEGPQAKVVLHKFSANSPEDALKVEGQSTAPSLNSEYDVLVKVEASTVTINDCLMRHGFDFSLFDPVCLPATPGSDVVGQIVQCGSKVEGFKPGDRVAALVRSGANARFLTVPASSLVTVPLMVSSEDAACMVSIYATAFKALKMVCEEGQSNLYDKKVVIVGGCDPVGQALIHLCKKAKASKIYVSAPSARHGSIRKSLGIIPLPASASEWPEEVKGEMDIVFDGECGNVDGSHAALNEQGKLLIYGMSAMLRDEDMGLFGAPMSAHMTKLGNNMRWRTQTLDIWDNFQKDPASYKADLKDLFRLLKWQKIKPDVSTRVSLQEVPTAHFKMEQMQVKGVVVCLPWKRTAFHGKGGTKVKARYNNGGTKVSARYKIGKDKRVMST